MHAEDIYVEKRDNQVEEMTENKLDRYYWRSQRSWDYGAGQQRFEQNLPGFPSNRAYLTSQGLDVFTNPSQATLLPAVTEILSLSNQGPNAPQKMVVTDNFVFVASGQPNVKRFSALSAADVVTLSTATETAQNVFDMATDGSIVYVALGPDGIHRVGVPTDTQRESFDSSAGYTTTGAPTVSADTTDFKEGTASLKVVSTVASTETKALTGAPLDLSAVTNFKIWLKQEPDPVAPTVLATTTAAKHSTLTNLTLSVANAQVGDLLLLYIANQNPARVPTPQGTGWIGLTNFISGTLLGTGDTSGWIYYRLVTAADGANPSVVVNDGGTIEMAAALKLIRGVDQTTPLSGAFLSTNGTDSATNSISSITTGTPLWSTTRKNTLVDNVGVAFINGSPPSVTVDGGNILDASSSTNANGLRLTTGHKTQVAIGTPSASTYTSTPAAATMIAAQVGVQPAQGTAKQLEIRLQTSAGNYFSRFVTPPAFSWSRDTSVRVTDWTATGAPNWASINSLVLVQGTANTVHYDDLVSTSTATFAHYSDPDYRSLGWAKDRLYGAGIKTGTQWAFREVGTAATSKEWLVLPDGYSVTDIQELGGYVYFSANRTSVSKIYAFDGINAPFVALTMPPGEQVTKMQPFLGAGMLIGARRSGSSSTSGMGVIYRAFPQGSGHLTTERITTLGNTTDGRDYAPQASTAYLDQVYMGNNFADVAQELSGMICYYPATGGFARHLEAVTGHGPVAGMGIYQNKKIFTVDTDGVYLESATGQLVTSGSVVSSVIDWNIDSAKILMKGEVATMPLPAGSSARLDYSLDQGTTFTTLTTSTTTGNTVISIPLASTNISAQIAQTRVVLTPDSTGLISPILKKAGLAAIYGIKPRRTYQLAIKAYSYMQLRNGTPHPQQGPTLPKTVENALQSLRDTQKIVQFQPPGWGEEQQTDNPNVRIGSLKTHRTWIAESGFAQICLVELFEVPS